MEIDKLLNDYNEIFDGQPWFGESLMSTVLAISFEQVNVKVQKNSHSIAGIIKHMLNWRKYVLEKLNGNREYEIVLNSNSDWEENFMVKDEEEWKGLIGELKNSHDQILSTIMKKSDDWLMLKTPSKDFTNDHLVRGIIYHDIYHLGQIRLILTLVKSNFNNDELL